MNEFSSDVKENYYEPQFKHETVEDWKNESNKMLKESGSGEVITNGRWYVFLVVFFVLGIATMLVLGIVFVMMVSDGKFQSSISQVVEPQIDNVVNNGYNFTSETDNEFNNNFHQNTTIVINSLNVYTNST